MKSTIFLVFIFLSIYALPTPPNKKRKLAGEKSDDIIIIHTNDVHCGVQDSIGYDGLMLFKKQFLARYNNVILVDAGDHIQGGTIGTITNGLSIIDIMNKIGYDVAILGNHEFDYGIAQLEECEKKLNCSYISSNYCYHKNKTSIYPAYKIIEKGGKKIAFIGVTTPQTLTKTFLITIQDENDQPVYDFLTDNNSQDLVDRVQTTINEVKANGADYVIIVAHLGKDGDALAENTSVGLLAKLKNVNALIDGHTHQVYSETTKDLENKDVIIAQTGTKLKKIGVFTIHTDWSITHKNYDNVTYDSIVDSDTLKIKRNEDDKEEIYVDKEMYNYINSIFDSFSGVLNRVVGRTPFPLNVYKDAKVSKESHGQMSRSSENALCNLATDAIRHFGEADVTIMNAGSVRDDINEGEITYQEIINVMPFSNDIITKKITGEDILNALEYGVRTLPSTTSRFPQVSGITYKIDVSINSTVKLTQNEEFEKVTGARRVYDVKVNGENIDSTKEYTIASNGFILSGGDGYSMFKDKETLSTSIGVDNEIILKYINETLNGVIPDKYSKTEGRIMKTIGRTLSEDIKIIHTNDVHCGVQDSIGYDGLMLYKKQLLTRYKNVILVDAGDHIQGGTIGLISNGLAIIDIMNKVGYDVATLGNHEFDYGVKQLEECAKELKCGYISTNYCFHKNKTSIYPAYKIIDVNGKKIAFIGVATPQTISKTYLITVTDEHGDLVYDFLTENHSQELFNRVQSHIDKVKSEGADYVIIVAHLGVDGDALEENTSRGLLNHLKNVDALIDGHTHLIYEKITQDSDGKNVTFAQTGTKLGVIGVFTIHTNGSITHENIDTVPYESVIDGDSLKVTRNKKEVWVDVNMYEYIKSTINSFSDVLNEVVGKTSFPLNVYKIGTVDKQSHNQLSRRGENAFCNLVADAMRILAGADVTILNAGSVREDIDEGDITYQEVINTMPFSNDVYTKEITGQAILDALEFGVRTLPNATSRFPQVSGITYKIDISIDSSVVVDKDEIFERVSGDRRVYDVKINGEDLDLKKIYSIAGSSFILEGGDGYSMFAHYEITKMSIGVDNEVLLNYIKKTLNGVIPDQYKMTEGRILKTQGKSLNQDIKIIHTNDVHCGVQDSIGYDGLMLYKKQLLTKYENVILVDAGDHIQGGTMGLVSNGLAIIDIMNKVGYDVATLGNHEFDYGVAQLEECAKELKCGYISTNYCLHKDKKAIYPAYKIIEKGGKKIAFIGVATPQTLSKTSLVTIRDENGEPVYDFLTENHSKELFERVQQQIDIVKSEGADYVIIVAHLGIDGDALEENTSRGLLNNLNGVDALIDGHTHLIYERTTKGKDNKDVLFAQTGTKLNVIGVFTIHTDGSITHENIEEVPYNADLYSDSLNITRNKKERWVDISMYEYIVALQNSYSETLNRVIGKTDFLLNVYAEGTVVKQSHAQLSRKGENAFCNLVADGIRTLGEADVTILNAGSVRDDILAGNITYQDVLNVMPFSNDIYTKEITGQAILDALEFGVRTLPDSTSRFPQVSGITYKIDISIDSSVVVDSDEIFIKVAGKRRVYDVKINGEKLDLLKTYSIAGSSFILEGGDGYSMFAPFEITKTSIGVDNEVLLKYITENLKGVIPLQYKTVEGRIVQTQGRTYDSGSSTDNNSVKYLKKFGNILSILLTLILF